MIELTREGGEMGFSRSERLVGCARSLLDFDLLGKELGKAFSLRSVHLAEIYVS